MPDRITLTIRYSFRGETHEPSVTLDLDRAMREEGRLPDFVLALASANGIDVYSYDYEVLPHGDFIWSHAEGLAAECLQDGEFDPACFEQRWRERERMDALRRIAWKRLGVDDLDAEPALRQALLDAWQRGSADAAD